MVETRGWGHFKVRSKLSGIAREPALLGRPLGKRMSGLAGLEVRVVALHICLTASAARYALLMHDMHLAHPDPVGARNGFICRPRHGTWLRRAGSGAAAG